MWAADESLNKKWLEFWLIENKPYFGLCLHRVKQQLTNMPSVFVFDY